MSRLGVRTRSRWIATGVLLAGVTMLSITALVLTGLGVMNTAGAEAPAPHLHTPSAVVEAGPVTVAVHGIVSRAAADIREIPVPESANLYAVVTRSGVRAGEAITAGTVITTVNERPLIAVPGPMPLYRALGPEHRGRDVAQVQIFLGKMGLSIGSDPPGMYGAGTAMAVHALYEKLGYDPVDASGASVDASMRAETGIPHGEMIAIGSRRMRAQQDCGSVGQVFENTVCTLASKKARLTVSLAPEDAALARPGMAVRVTVEGAEKKLRLGAALPTDPSAGSLGNAAPGGEGGEPSSETGPEDPAESAEPTSHVIYTVRASRPVSVALTDGLPARVILEETAPNALRVVSIAVRTTPGGGASWLLRTDGTRIPVTVGVCADGYCSIEGDVVEGVSVALPEVVAGTGSE